MGHSLLTPLLEDTEDLKGNRRVQFTSPVSNLAKYGDFYLLRLCASSRSALIYPIVLGK